MNTIETVSARERYQQLTSKLRELHRQAIAAQRDLTPEEHKRWDRLLAERAQLEQVLAAAEGFEGWRGRIQQELDQEDAWMKRPLGRLTSPQRPIGQYGRLEYRPMSTIHRGENWLAGLNPSDDGGFGSLGEFLQAVANAGAGKYDTRLEACAARARQFTVDSTDGPSGGFAIPTAHLVHVFAGLDQDEYPMLSRCDKAMLNVPRAEIPLLVDSSHATSPYGINWTCHSESSEWSAADTPLMESISVNCKTWGGLVRVSNEWLADAVPAMRERLQRAFVSSLRWKLEQLIVRGSGAAGEFVGVLNAPGKVTVTKEDGQAADTITLANVLGMWARLLPVAGAENHSIWLAHPSTKSQLASLCLEGNASSVAAGLLRTGDSAPAERLPATQLLGKPVYFTELCNVLGDEGDLVLADPRRYLLVLREGVTVVADRSRYFEYNQTAFRVMFRADGLPIDREAFTPHKGSDTMSSIVTLAARQ